MQPGFYYNILKSDEPNKPAEGGSSYWWCFCFGRGDGIQILLNNGSSASDAVLYLRRGSINTHIWKNWYKWELNSVIQQHGRKITPYLFTILGALEHATVRDNTTSFDDLPEGSIRLIGTRNEGRPDGTEGSLLVCITFFKPTATSGGGLIQVAFKWLGASATAMTIYVRQTNGDGIFCPWNTLSLT